MADTTTKGFPYPEGPDLVDVAGDIQLLAEAVDDMPGIQSYTSTEIAGLAVGDKWAGRVVWNSTTGTLQVSNGSTFSDVAGNVTIDSIGGVAKTLIDAKGDLIVGTAADTVARLGVGTNGHYLQADSGTTPGVKWAAAPVSISLLLLMGA